MLSKFSLRGQDSVPFPLGFEGGPCDAMAIIRYNGHHAKWMSTRNNARNGTFRAVL